MDGWIDLLHRRIRTGRALAVTMHARLVAQAEGGGRVRVVRGQRRREAELEQHTPLAHVERVGEQNLDEYRQAIRDE